MSFFSNFSSDRCPGTISGNPLNGLCEKVCIQAEKIFDAGIVQTRLENYAITLEDPTPANPTYPLTFISARSLSAEGDVSNLTVERQAEGQCARVQATVTIPIEVVYVDASGVEGKATASVVIPQDVLMYVPPASIMPFNVTAIASAVAPDGVWNAAAESFTISVCITVILKVSMQVELLVPSYGYCAIPPAQEYAQEVCSGFFELPLYPQGRACSKK
ncbi:MAG: hypothetical protein J6C93_02745 [Clostridia bacterium]|nr:hypothetical protein [Clostridia bacterium]